MICCFIHRKIVNRRNGCLTEWHVEFCVVYVFATNEQQCDQKFRFILFVYTHDRLYKSGCEFGEKLLRYLLTQYFNLIEIVKKYLRCSELDSLTYFTITMATIFYTCYTQSAYVTTCNTFIYLNIFVRSVCI